MVKRIIFHSDIFEYRSGEIEVDYLGKSTRDREKFEECFNFLCNYNGLSSTLNRLIIEIENKRMEIKVISYQIEKFIQFVYTRVSC